MSRLAVNPNNGEILAGFSHLLMVLGRPDEALAQIKKGLDLDPFNIVVQGFYAMDLLFIRRYDEAIAQARGYWKRLGRGWRAWAGDLAWSDQYLIRCPSEN